jgi:microcystin degradation protein MlrC
MSFKVLSAEIMHETNTFNIYPTTIDSFEARYLLNRAQAIEARGDQNTELAGLLDVSRAYAWDVMHTISAAAGPGGIVTRDAFDRLVKPLTDAVDGPWDGIFLMLHGAMVTEFCEDGEGEILRRLRAVTGRDLPIAVTLDPHANVTAAMCRDAQILVSYTTYPHVDMRTTGQRTAELLQRTMSGDIAPVTLRAHRPMLEEANGGRTDLGPMIERHAQARAFEARKGVYAVSINGAFASADIKEVGPTVLVTCDGCTNDHQSIAEFIADDIWNCRHDPLNTYLTCTAAADVAQSWNRTAGPLVIADYADNPGAGAYGDATHLLSALLMAGVTDACFGPLVDPVAAKFLTTLDVGRDVTLEIGGATIPHMGGGPLRVTGKVVWAGDGRVIGNGPIMNGLVRDFGATAVLNVAGIDILIVSLPHQMLDLKQFETFGVEPTLKSVVAVKSMQHFRAAFTPIAGRIIVCDSGALCTLDYGSLEYKNVPRPTFPLR